METRISSFKDLKKLRNELSTGAGLISIEGHLKVYPEREYEIHDLIELEVAMEQIRLFSSQYASMDGSVKFGKGPKIEQ